MKLFHDVVDSYHVTVLLSIGDITSCLSFSIFVAFVLEAFFMEYSVEKSDLHTSVERKIEELQLSVAQYVFVPPSSCLGFPAYFSTTWTGAVFISRELKSLVTTQTQL